MPFEPRLFREDDDFSAAENALPAPVNSDEFELPADLAMLAGQLVDDADFLASRFPANEQPAEFGRRALAAIGAEDGSSSEPRGAALRSAATDDSRHASQLGKRPRSAGRWLRWGGVAAALLIWLAMGEIVERQTSDRDDPTRLVEAPIAAPVRSFPSTRRGATLNLETVPPAAVFRGLTGAEQEAVLDLIQDDSASEAQLSI